MEQYKCETLKADSLNNYKEITMNTDLQMATILAYCHQLSRLVAPNTAESVGLIGFDGSVCDFLKDLAVAESNGEALCIEGDEFYEEVYNKMKESIDNIYN